MTNNRRIANSVFNELIRNNLIPTDIEFGNGYFIFEMGDDSVVHFHVKGCKGWKFGMWINTGNEDNIIQYFAQYEDNIDKFKPSRSSFCENVSLASLREVRRDKEKVKEGKYFFIMAYHKIVEMTLHIKNNPKLAYLQDSMYDTYITEPSHKAYRRQKFDDYKYKVRKIKEHITDEVFAYNFNKFSAKIAKKRFANVIEDIEIIDNNTEDWSCSPRYDAKFTYKPIFENKDDMIALVNIFTNYWCPKWLFTTRNTSYEDFIYEDGKLIRI